jgi:nicotinamide mononucleotide adenylyltransferase
MWLRPKFERHPLDFNVLALDRFSQRKLREVAERSEVIGVDLDLEAHNQPRNSRTIHTIRLKSTLSNKPVISGI